MLRRAADTVRDQAGRIAQAGALERRLAAAEDREELRIQRELETRTQLRSLTERIVALETQLQDAGVRLAQARADRDTMLSFVQQRLEDRRPLLEEIGGLRHDNQLLLDELSRAKRLLSDVERIRISGSERSVLEQDIARLRQCVMDLQKSRWRKIGLRFGLAKLAAWEKNGAL
jgi:chromosome segregation ATPase